eukprot:scaffold39514_cov27-Prasinocladus_malaysianus.AAC.3
MVDVGALAAGVLMRKALDDLKQQLVRQRTQQRCWVSAYVALLGVCVWSGVVGGVSDGMAVTVGVGLGCNC